MALATLVEGLLLGACTGVFLFVALWGLGHWAPDVGDRMGLEVRDARTGEVLGKLEDVLTLPANNVYVVRGGEREWMIPAVPEFIAETNVQEGYVRVNLMEGL